MVLIIPFYLSLQMGILSVLGALFMGLLLGLLGAGGGILTVPILVYWVGVDGYTASAYSLFVVFVTAFVGAVSHIIRKTILIQALFKFGIPSLVSVFISRAFILPLIPNTIFSFGDWEFTKNHLILFLLSLVMIWSSVSMIRSQPATSDGKQVSSLRIIMAGLVVGLITGVLGAGGGFVLIPTMVKLLNISIKQAIGTSLSIICINTGIGFFIYSRTAHDIDWHLLSWFTTLAILGILLGGYLAKWVPDQKLKPIFGWFVLTVGIFIFVKELFLQ